ncbi:MAG: DUF1593 domain-containing protein [Bacteroidales bacterium]|nr:DUF1593 domain-containing protein [Bacteroidales bacterium]
MKRFLSIMALAAVALAACSPKQEQPQKPRVIVTCDPELDDHNSLIRYLLFSTDFDTEGIIYASSQFHWKGDGKGGTQFIPGREYDRGDHHLGPQTHWRWAEGERFIDEDVEAYEKVYPLLVKHNADYPSPEYLKSIIREGNVWFEGEMEHDTPGSDLIKEVLLDDDPRPVFIQVWGGPSTASRALKSIQEQYEGTPEWEAVKARVSAKTKFCLSGQQDQTYRGYVQKQWPEIESIILNAGVTPMGYGAKRSVYDQADTLYYSAAWTSENIKSKGIFGEMYRVWGDGKQMAEGDFTDYFGLKGYSREELVAMGYWVWSPPQPEGNFISEGDTPCYLNLIGNGLRAWEDQAWGGWGGRRRTLSDEERQAGFTAPYAMRGTQDAVLPSFVAAVQNNFAARMAWTVTPNYADANHEPLVAGPLALSGKPGKTLKIKASASDPDGDALHCSWAQWKVDGSYQGDVTLSDTTAPATSVTIPADARSGDTIHLVLTVSDNGTPQCTSYLRTIITVE